MADLGTEAGTLGRSLGIPIIVTPKLLSPLRRYASIEVRCGYDKMGVYSKTAIQLLGVWQYGYAVTDVETTWLGRHDLGMLVRAF